MSDEVILHCLCGGELEPLIVESKGKVLPWQGEYVCLECGKSFLPDEIVVPIDYKFPPPADRLLKKILREENSKGKKKGFG